MSRRSLSPRDIRSVSKNQWRSCWLAVRNTDCPSQPVGLICWSTRYAEMQAWKSEETSVDRSIVPTPKLCIAGRSKPFVLSLLRLCSGQATPQSGEVEEQLHNA